MWCRRAWAFDLDLPSSKTKKTYPYLRRVPGRCRPVLFENGAQLPEGLHGHPWADPVVVSHDDRLLLLGLWVDDFRLDRHNLVAEAAGSLSSGGARVRAGRELVLDVAADAVARGDVLGGDAWIVWRRKGGKGERTRSKNYGKMCHFRANFAVSRLKRRFRFTDSSQTTPQCLTEERGERRGDEERKRGRNEQRDALFDHSSRLSPLRSAAPPLRSLQNHS